MTVRGLYMYLFSCGLHNTECVTYLLKQFSRSRSTCLLRSALSRANFDGRLSWAETTLVADPRAGWRQVFAGGLTTTALVVVHALGADIFCNVQTCICGVMLSRTLLHSHGARHNLYWIVLVDHDRYNSIANPTQARGGLPWMEPPHL